MWSVLVGCTRFSNQCMHFFCLDLPGKRLVMHNRVLCGTKMYCVLPCIDTLINKLISLKDIAPFFGPLIAGFPLHMQD